MNPNFYEKMINRINKSKTNWEAKKVKKSMIDNYNETF